MSCIRPQMKGISRGVVCSSSQLRLYRFSAFWLRSSVVSVLISLISDTSPIWGLHIKRIFGLGSRIRGLLHSLHASTWHCSAAGSGASSPVLFKGKKKKKTDRFSWQSVKKVYVGPVDSVPASEIVEWGLRLVRGSCRFAIFSYFKYILMPLF